MPLSALGGQNLSVTRHLVGGRDLRPLQSYILDAKGESVPPLGPCFSVAVEEELCPNIRQGVRQQAGLSVVAENAIEGFDVRVNGQLKRGVRGVVLGGVLEEMLATESVVLVVPLRARHRRSHGAQGEEGRSKRCWAEMAAGLGVPSLADLCAVAGIAVTSARCVLTGASGLSGKHRSSQDEEKLSRAPRLGLSPEKEKKSGRPISAGHMSERLIDRPPPAKAGCRRYIWSSGPSQTTDATTASRTTDATTAPRGAEKRAPPGDGTPWRT